MPDVLAAVDLGSNSFHMVVARYSHGQLIIVDRLREMVRLAAGLDAQGRLHPDSIARALACLERFGQRLRDIKAESVRAVGTNTLRKARRKGAFLDMAAAALGHPIDIISGVEEARLIHLGVAHTTPSEGRRLVVDIGGGSTEIIIGEGFTARQLESLYMGCVSLSAAYFGDGKITEKRMNKARVAAQLELEPIVSAFGRSDWDVAFGASGTLRAIGEVMVQRGDPNGLITRDGLEWMLQECLRAGDTGKLHLPGMASERQEVIVGGLAIIVAVFDMLKIDAMRVADGALREGLLYDLLGRLTDEDARVRSVRGMEQRYHVDAAQADRVEATAGAFLQQVRDDWGLNEPLTDLVLGWAARLHEVGLDISHSHYHRHSAYLLKHADMQGFPREEQQLLAALVGSHRRKPRFEGVESLVPPWHINAEYLIVLLRLAVLLHRGRGPRALPEVKLRAKHRSLDLEFPGGWLESQPLTAADLEQESKYLAARGLKLRVV